MKKLYWVNDKPQYVAYKYNEHASKFFIGENAPADTAEVKYVELGELTALIEHYGVLLTKYKNAHRSGVIKLVPNGTNEGIFLRAKSKIEEALSYGLKAIDETSSSEEERGKRKGEMIKNFPLRYRV